MGDDHCPICREKVDSVSSVEGDYKPTPKSLTVCMYCVGILMFEDDMALLEFPEILIETLDQETKSNLAKAMVGIMKHVPAKTPALYQLRISNLNKYDSRF